MNFANKLYMAVNPDGTEIMTNYHPFRIWDKMTENSTEEYRKKYPIYKRTQNYWCDMMCDTDYGYYGVDYTFEGIEVPGGTIKKITGKSLTWNDEPVKIDF